MSINFGETGKYTVDFPGNHSRDCVRLGRATGGRFIGSNHLKPIRTSEEDWRTF
jgi:hypothetical protein